MDDLYCGFLVDVCRAKGLHVPGDVAIAGTGNETVICTAPQPSLSSIDLGHARKGCRAAKLLDSLIEWRATADRAGNPVARGIGPALVH